jgi:sialate O-acetylesterase
MHLNKTNRLFPWILILEVTVILCGVSLGEIRMPAVFGSRMVLQQDQPILLWGWSEPGERITVTFRGQAVTTQADDAGKWRMTLASEKADENPASLAVKGSRSPAVVMEDVLVGEVWLASGQSNMEWTLNRTHTPIPEIQRAHYPRIRLFQVPRRASAEPESDVDAGWVASSPDTVRGFSAVAYYFGRELHHNLEVPVGLIQAAWGGTRIEPWTPVSGFRTEDETASILEDIQAAHQEYKHIVQKALPQWISWIKAAQDSLDRNGQPPALVPEPPQHPLAHSRQPTALFNGMIHPLVPYAIRGAIWYQGEANRNDGLAYRPKMEALIQGWREVWDNADLAFYYVQLAPFNYAYSPEESGSDVLDFQRLPLIWEAQSEVLALPHTGMAVVTDITNLNDIHPRNKKEVGRRLSLWALARTYGRTELVYSGPLYESMEKSQGRIRLFFDHADSGLVSLDGRPLSWFEIAGPDHIFYKAQAQIDGKTVVVWSPRVLEPEAVRMGWHQLAVPNLGNREGLPASPFRTDRW